MDVKMSDKGPFIVLRVVGLLLLIALLTGGGFMAYSTGVAQGVEQAPAVAEAISQAAENGQVAPVPPMMYGPGYGYQPYSFGYRHHFGFVPFGICGSILFLFLFFGFLRMIFFRGWHGGHMHGPWGRHWENGVPSRFDEWHKRAHGEKPVEDGDKKE
jgi:hypothetical protein